ncbi:MAG: carbohydrate kinase family protein [Chloroflexota bacterium]
MITPAAVLVVDEWPPHNTGAVTKMVREFISDDAAIVACLLRGWDVRSGLIGTELGKDRRGRGVRRRLKKLGVAGEVRLRRGLTTPFEVNISDKTGARTYFWQRDPAVLATLDTADLSLLNQAHLLYVDWYDGDHILRPMDEARRLDVPVFLNLEYGHQDGRILEQYTRRATFVQAVTDPAQRGGDSLAVARKLVAAGAQVALVTLAGEGCLAAQGDQAWRVYAPSVQVVDGCGAGATFSAGFILGCLNGWGVAESVRLATAAASLKCALIGPQAPPLEEVQNLAAGLHVETLAVGNDYGGYRP